MWLLLTDSAWLTCVSPELEPTIRAEGMIKTPFSSSHTTAWPRQSPTARSS